MSKPRSSGQQEIKIGVITSFTYLSDDKVFGVAMFALDDGPDIRICGNIAGYAEGSYLELYGHYQHNSKYNEMQFQVSLSMPAERKGNRIDASSSSRSTGRGRGPNRSLISS